MKYIFTGELITRDWEQQIAAVEYDYRKIMRFDKEIRAYDFVSGAKYTILCSYDMKYVIDEDRHRYISQELFDIYFKSIDEVRDIKIVQLLA